MHFLNTFLKVILLLSTIFTEAKSLSRQKRVVHPLRLPYQSRSTVYIQTQNYNPLTNKPNFGSKACSGSILSNRIILSAAHCYSTNNSKINHLPPIHKITIHLGLDQTVIRDENINNDQLISSKRSMPNLMRITGLQTSSNDS